MLLYKNKNAVFRPPPSFESSMAFSAASTTSLFSGLFRGNNPGPNENLGFSSGGVLFSGVYAGTNPSDTSTTFSFGV